MKEEEYAIYIKPLYENWTLEEAKERIRKAQEENEDILEEITKRIIDAEAENTKLKQDNEKQTKTYQKILQEQQAEIDNLQRNCDVFNEQMNDAVERTVELNKEKQELKEWLEEEIKNCNPTPELYFKVEEEFKSKFYQKVLERLGE